MLSRVNNKLQIILTAALASELAGMMARGCLYGGFSAGRYSAGGIVVGFRKET